MNQTADLDREQLLDQARAGDNLALGRLLEVYRAYLEEAERRLGYRTVAMGKIAIRDDEDEK